MDVRDRSAAVRSIRHGRVFAGALVITATLGIGACSLTDTSGVSGGRQPAGLISAGADGGPDSSDAGNASDASDASAPDGNKVSIACGTAVCEDDFVCCMAGPSDLSCAKQCPTGTLVIRCDDPTDCPDGNSCCAAGWASTMPGDVSCAPGACGGVKDAARCIVAQAGTCPAALACRADLTSTGYAFHSCQ